MPLFFAFIPLPHHELQVLQQHLAQGADRLGVLAELDGSWKQQQNQELEQWRERYEQLARVAEETAGENKRLALILSEKERLLGDMSLRLQDLEEKIKAKGYMVGGQTLTINDSNKLLVNRINVLERQLRDEQTKNKTKAKISS